LALFVLVLGGLLMAAGGGYLLLGFDIVMTERGSAMTIGGAVALAGGVVTIGIGCAVLRLTQILRALETTGKRSADDADQVTAVEDKPVAGLAAGAAAGIATAGLAAASAASDAQAAPMESPDPSGSEAAALAAAEAASVPADPDPLKDIMDQIMSDAVPRPDASAAEADAGPVEPEPEPDLDIPVVAAANDDVDAHEGAPPAAEPTDHAVEDLSDDEDTGEAPVVRPAEPTVLGNYRAGGRTYTMYSNGAVEAATEDGVERFESMQALRDHLAKT
jgi:hypothetical protein